MLKTPGVEKQLFAILEAGRTDLIAPFFNLWSNEEEMIDKVILFGHYFLDHYFRDTSPEFHREIIRRFFTKRNEYTAAPRGFSKTTILQTCCMFSIANKMDLFIVIVEKTFTEAGEVIKGIHDEFVDNEKLLEAYGHLVGRGATNTDQLRGKRLNVKEAETKGDVFINGVRIRGKGFNSSIRGLKTRAWRPTRIVLDDVEEDEHISNPEQRLKYENNYNKGIQPAIDVDGVIKVFGTILHQDSLLNNLIANHKGVIYRAHAGSDPAIAPAESFLWPARWSRERLIQKRNDMMSSGQSTNAYAQEYLNDPISDDERTFKFDWLWEMIDKPDGTGQYRVPKQRITMTEFEKIRRKTTLNGYAMIDCADATTANADWTGVIVVFVAPNGARFRVDVRREKRNIKGVIDLIFEVWEKWAKHGLIKIGIEKKAFDDQILPLFDEEKQRRTNVYPVVEELKPMARNKQNRIKGALQGFYETGKIVSVGRIDEQGYFRAVGDTNVLLEELHDHPNAKHDDLSDAEAYGGDIIVVPLADEDRTRTHRTPQDDPFENEKTVRAFNPDEFNNYSNPVGAYDDADPY